MVDAEQHVSIFLVSWSFWFSIIYMFIHFFLKKQGIKMATKHKTMASAKGALFFSTATAAIRLILWGMHQPV